MRRSLNEVEVTARKAAIGAGLPLGLAEEAGMMAAWLGAAGFPVAELLLAGLEGVGHGGGRLDWAGPDRSITSGGGPLSAMIAGPSACDLVVAAAAGGEAVSVHMVVDVPLIAVAQAAVASAASGMPLAVDIEAELRALCRGERVGLHGTVEMLSSWRRRPVRVRTPSAGDDVAPARITPAILERARRTALESGVSIETSPWERVQALAARMLVPATMQSREQGAGAGLIDTD